MNVFNRNEFEKFQIIAQDKDTLTQQGVVIENVDMVIASTSRIAEYINEGIANAHFSGKTPYWKISELAKNAAGDVIGVKIYYEATKPAWVTDPIFNWIIA